MTSSPLFHSLAQGPSSLIPGDVTLVCGDGHLSCHSLLLAAASPFWRLLLQEQEEQHTVLLPGTSLLLLRHLLSLLHTGSTTPTPASVPELQSLLAGLLPHLAIKVLEQELTLEKKKKKHEDSREMGRYQPVSQTDLMTSWSKDEDQGDDRMEDNISLADEPEVDQPVLKNQTLIANSESMKKIDNKCCQVCQKTFLYPKDLKKHELIHEKSFPFHCKLCKKGIRTISNMYKHLRVKHLLQDDLKSHILDDSGNPYVDPKVVLDKVLSSGDIPSSFLDPSHVIAQGSHGQNSSGAELYKCLVCEKLVTKYALKNHLNNHNGDNKFKCDLCPKAYNTNSSLANHKVASHQDIKGTFFNCPGCFRSFRTMKVRDHHATTCLKKSQSNRAAYECRLCNKMFGYKNNLVAHQGSVHGLETKKILDYKCKHCSEMVKGKLKLSKHIISAHPDATGELCDLCGKSFKTEIKLLRHISVHKSRERNLHCSFCPKKFFRKDILAVHEKVHTNPIICKECGKKFPEERYLENHMLLHQEKTHDCIYCARSFASQDHLAKHYETHDEKISNICNFCSKAFRSKFELKKHRAEHSDEFPLKCHICHKGFLHDSQLEKHVDLVHSKTAKLLIYCQHCEEEHNQSGQEFSSLYSLKRHLMRHKCRVVAKTSESCDVCARDPETYYKLKNHIRVNEIKKVLPCDHCDKKFKTTQDLNTHLVVHTGQKPFSCQLCGDKFTQKCSLKTHYQRHKQGTVGSQAFQCPICHKSCKTYAALKSHRKSHQGGAVVGSKEVQDSRNSDVVGTFPQLVFQSESGLPQLLSLDSSQQYHVTTINLDSEELEVESGGGLEGLILEPGLVGLARGGLGMEGEYKIHIIDDLPMTSSAGPARL